MLLLNFAKIDVGTEQSLGYYQIGLQFRHQIKMSLVLVVLNNSPTNCLSAVKIIILYFYVKFNVAKCN